MSKHSSIQAGINGTHIEALIMGVSSNPSNLIDDIDNRTEIKSCQDYYFYYHHKAIEKRAGNFKINIEQHKHLLEINGFYLFVVHNLALEEITFCKIVSAKNIEIMFNFLNKPITKDHYFNITWKKLI